MSSKIERVEATIVYHKGGALALMASEKPRLVSDDVGIEATGQMIHFAPEVAGSANSAMPLAAAMAPIGGVQRQTLTLDAQDGVICKPAGPHLASLVASKEISFECSKARLPTLKDYRPRAELLAQADRDAQVVAEVSELDGLRARLAALEGARA
jgi:hypothetical protein